ncbi:MAG: uracil phosphoribosyltransferase [Gemmataceae bacterium]|nr:uracil phosphoribosyltransferase [Gemmataceae bacterium]
MSSHVHVSRHALVQHFLGPLRDVGTQPELFRGLVRRLTQLLFAEATAALPLREARVRTPLTECKATRLSETIGIAPVLRAGLGMVDPILEWIPEAKVLHLGMYRDPATCQPVPYYSKLHGQQPPDRCYLLDPMLATGGSAAAAIGMLKEWGATNIACLSLIGAPEGAAHLHDAHPDVAIFLAALDERLDERSYIVPGLGDAGDRQFGTDHA